MKIIMVSLMVLAPYTLLAQAEEKEASFSIGQLKGFVSNYDPSNLRDDLAHDAQNVLFDKDLGTAKPDGFTLENSVTFGSQTVQEMGDFIDSAGNEYLVVVTSNVLAYEVGAGTFTTIISTVNTSSSYKCVSAFNRFICSSSSSAFQWTGGPKTVDVTTFPTAFPLGSLLEKHANRLWVAGVKGNGSILYGSGFLNPDNWTLAPNAGDPVQITLGLNDGDNITCMKSFNDGLVVGKKNSMWALIGKSQNDFTVVSLSPVIGCIQDKSMQIKQGRLFWISKRGIEKLDGGQITLVSDPVKDIVDKVISGYDVTTVNSVTDTSQSDFDLGTSTYTSSIQPIGSVSIATRAVDDLTSLHDVANIVHLYDNGVGCTGCQGRQNAIAQKFVPKIDCNLLQFNFMVTRNMVPPGNSVVYMARLSSGNNITSFPSMVILDTSPQIDMGNNTGGTDQDELKTFNFFSTNSILKQGSTYWVVLTTANTQVSGNSYVRVHITSNSPNSENNEYAYSLQGPGSSGFSWARDKQGFSMRFSAVVSSGTFNSSIKDLGGSLKSVSFFNSNFSLNGGGLQFYSRGATSPSAIGSTSWSIQSLGSTAAVNNNRYVQWRTDFGIQFASQSPSIQDVTIQWFDLNSKQNVTSWVNDDRYYLACSTNTNSQAYNETVLVIDKFDNFTKLNDLKASSYAEAFQNRYFGTSASTGGSSGNVYRFTSVLNYNGNPINSFVETKDYAGDCSECLKDWGRLYIKTRAGTSGGTLSTQYQFDRDGTYTSMGDISLTEDLGIINEKVPFVLGSGGVLGKAVRFKFSNNQFNQDLRLLGAKVFYTPRPVE